MDQLPWWFWPFLATLILIAIHTYFGLHVISRKVLFVDLAIAQIAALGSSVAFLFGFEPRDPVTYWASLAFGIMGAFIFSVTRTRDERVPHEAIIGLAFAIASAAAILLSAENPHGAEHLRDIMAGSILVVTPEEVRTDAILYSAIGGLHWILRKRFLAVSLDPERAQREGINVQRWDFLFYVTFAIIVTMSVHIAGVLLVFCLLIAPAVCGSLFSSSFRVRLVIGWVTSIAAALVGLFVSSHFDWPPAPSIIAVYAVILIGAGVLSRTRGSANPLRALMPVAASALVMGTLGYGMVTFLRSDFAHGNREAHTHDHEHETTAHALEDATAVPALAKALTSSAAEVREKAAGALQTIGSQEAIAVLEHAFDVGDEDEWVRLRIVEGLLRATGEIRALRALFDLAKTGDAKAVRADATRLACAFLRDGANEAPCTKDLAALEKAWATMEPHARWDAAEGRFIGH